MDLRDITQCKRDLDFLPVAPSVSSLPAVAWRGYLITGFEKTEGAALSTEASIVQLMRDCYPNLSLPEIARFLEKLQSLPVQYWKDVVDELLAVYQLKTHPELLEIFEIILTMPIEIQNYISTKSLAPRELYPLRQIMKRQPDVLKGFNFDLFSNLKNKKASKSQIARTVELASDLFLLGKNIWPEPGQSIEHWISNLETLRYPQTTAYDQEQKETLNQISWPSKIQAKWVREGDSAGIEVKFSVHSPAEFEKFLNGLQNVVPQIKDNLWKSH